MKITKQNTEFNPITIVLENQEDLDTFCDMVRQAALATEQDRVYWMTVDISNWLAKEKF